LEAVGETHLDSGIAARVGLPALSAPRQLAAGAAVRAVALLALATLCLAVAHVVFNAAAGPSGLVPASRAGFADWLAGPLQELGVQRSAPDIAHSLVIAFGAYVVAVLCWRGLPRQALIGAIVALHVLLLLGPPLLSADVFGYLAYGRLGINGIDPYVHGAAALPDDPLRAFVLWRDMPSPYGPLFTLATYALAPLGPAAGLWALKAVAVTASLGCVALVWKIAERLGHEPIAAAALVGLNPILLVYAVGGAHNDLLVMLLALGGILALVSGRPRGAGVAVVGAAALKASAGLVLVFALAGNRGTSRRRLAVAVVVATAVVGAITLLVFQSGAGQVVSQVLTQQRLVALHSVPGKLASLLGAPGSRAIRFGAAAIGGVAICALLVRTLRGANWLTSAGWATLALLMTTAWLLPWYVVWLLPLAAVASDRRLTAATLGFTGFVVATHVSFLLG
jgi:alpha-1,6-mannosyltransferase